MIRPVYSAAREGSLATERERRATARLAPVLVSLLGAVVLLAIVNLFRRGRVR